MSTVGDPYNLQRFVDAQDPVYEEVRRELRGGRKQGHWMWFVFPQLKGLGRSGAADYFGIGSMQEARAYLAHPVLGPRLRECAGLLVTLAALRPARLIVGAVDELKLRSSMTLFAAATEDNAVFRGVLDRFYAGADDPRTLALLSGG